MTEEIKAAIKAVQKARGAQQKAAAADWGSNSLYEVGYDLGQAEELLSEALTQADQYVRWKKHQRN